MNVVNDQILTTTMAGTTPVVSSIIPTDNLYTLAIQHVAAGTTAAGTIQLQASCDQGRDEQGNDVTNWANIDTAVTLTAIGAGIINKDGIGYKWARVLYTPNNGNGTLTITMNGKSF